MTYFASTLYVCMKCSLSTYLLIQSSFVCILNPTTYDTAFPLPSPLSITLLLCHRIPLHFHAQHNEIVFDREGLASHFFDPLISTIIRIGHFLFFFPPGKWEVVKLYRGI